MNTFFLCVFVICLPYVVIAQLDIKSFLGDEPLTPRDIVEDLLEYFQQEDPKGIPVLEIPEVIEAEGPVTLTKVTATDLRIKGHSEISLEYVDVNLEKLQFQVRLNIPHLEIMGDYLWIGYLANSEGEMNITFVNLDVGTICDFGVVDDGVIQIINVEVIFDAEEFLPHFTGISYEHTIMVSAADTLFNTMVSPLISNMANEKVLPKINDRLREKLKENAFPVDISPVDYLIAKFRSDISREKNLDPYRVDIKEINSYGLTLVLENIELRGLSTLHRSDVIRTEFVDKRIYVTIEIGTQALKASSDWSLYSSLIPIGSGHVDLHIESLRVSLEVQQDMDLRHPPILRRIDIEMGNIGLRSRGERNIDYVLEAAVNVFPNIFRDVIMDKKVEQMLKKKVQERFNTLNLQHIIYDRLNKMENKPLVF